jgi:hypothetical protein
MGRSDLPPLPVPQAEEEKVKIAWLDKFEAARYLDTAAHDTDCPVEMGVPFWPCECGLLALRRILAAIRASRRPHAARRKPK